MEVNMLKQIILVLIIGGLALALIYLAFKDTLANMIFDLPTAFIKTFNG